MPAIHWITGSFDQRGPNLVGQKSVGSVEGGLGTRYVLGGAVATQSGKSGSAMSEVEVGFSEKFEIELDPGQTECELWAMFVLVGAAYAQTAGDWGLSLGTAFVDGWIKSKVLEGCGEILTFDHMIRYDASSRWLSAFEGDKQIGVRLMNRTVQANDVYTLDINMKLLANASVSIKLVSTSASANVIFSPPPGATTILWVR